ncbi:RNA-directed DNA polymerase, eukaryota [Tanacetum coccineum]
MYEVPLTDVTSVETIGENYVEVMFHIDNLHTLISTNKDGNPGLFMKLGNSQYVKISFAPRVRNSTPAMAFKEWLNSVECVRLGKQTESAAFTVRWWTSLFPLRNLKQVRGSLLFASVRFIKVFNLDRMIILHDEGFMDVKLKYLGGMWVMFEFEKEETKTNMLTHTGVNSWFHTIQDVIHDFAFASALLGGYRVRSLNPGKTVKLFPELEKNGGIFIQWRFRASTIFRGIRFELYDLLEKKKSGGVLHVPSPSLSHPHGFTPVVNHDIENDIVHKLGMKMAQWFNEECRWNGEAILMGDFNEVRSRDERRGSWFNPSGARDFNHFISSSGLVDVKLEGYSFTWSHPSATKMSKLDRFLVSDGVVSLFPSISALCLDRHLSDHRPILLREVQLDFGPIPFRFYHSWFSYDGFDELVEQTWRSFSHSDRNGMIRFRKKLQDLKITIRQWIKDKRMHLSSSKQAIHDELTAIDKELDCGMATDTSLARRQELKRQLQDIKVKEDVDSIQKSKVKWAIEGDENSSFFHGIINKRRSQLAIRGIFVDGIWQNDPQAVKEAFLNHFEARFKKPTSSGPKINFLFPKRFGAKFRWGLYLIMTSLLAFGFGSKWCQWIRGTFCFAKASILVNGSPSNEFQFHCGLKQGDPLAPLLFILVMESLHLSFCRVVQAGMFKGIRLNSSISVSHLFYADDALIIGEWSSDNLRGIINVLKCFYLASGLQINIHKSQLLGVGVPKSEVESAASSIGCSIMNNQFRYLGVMVGENMARHKAWVDVVLKLKFRLSKWKAKTLSIGGRLTLLKSVLGASPLYNMSIFKAPKGVLKEMESIRNNFFIGADLSDKKITWVAWNKVLASKKKGGLGVSSFYALNRALLLKWVWRFVSQDGSLWFQVIQAIYGSTIDSHSVQMASNWCSILREMLLLKSKGFDFMSLCSKRVGNGNNTSFWLDIWKGDSTLRDDFPRMYAIELDKQISVADKMAAHVDASFRKDLLRGPKSQIVEVVIRVDPLFTLA